MAASSSFFVLPTKESWEKRREENEAPASRKKAKNLARSKQSAFNSGIPQGSVQWAMLFRILIHKGLESDICL